MASIRWREDRNSWQLTWQEIAPNGKKAQRRRSLGNIPENEAEIIRLQKELELRTGKPIAAIHGLPFYDLASEYIRWHATEYPDSHNRVRQIIEDHLEPYFGPHPINFVKVRLGEQYKVERLNSKAKPKRATVAKEIRTLKAMLNKAVEWEYLDFSPIAKLKPPQILDSKAPRFYTLAEMEAIYCAAPFNHWKWRFYANTGVRLSESLHIKNAWIGRESMKVESIEDERTKSGKWREIPLNESALMAIERFNRKDEKYLFPRENPKSISRAFARVLNRAEGIATPKGSLHCLRHTYCSHLVMAGKPLRLVQKLAGHSKMETTEHYAHLAPNYIADMGGMPNI